MQEHPKEIVPSFSQALRFWFRLGWISFGGPAGQIALMHRELVEQKRWIDEAHFLHALNYCMLLPGPEAQQLATYLGWLMHGKRGGIAAGLLFILPAVFILLLLSWLYVAQGQQAWMLGLFAGLKPAVAALIIYACIRLARRSLKQPWMKWISLAAFLALAVFNIPFPWIIAAAALLGVAFNPRLFSQAAPVPEPVQTHRGLLRRSLSVLALGLVCWLIPFALLWSLGGWDQGFTQMAWFFTSAALLCFGGAYAVLPYVIQGAVQHYHWLSPAQMLDGLALGESTPGPLIMVINFVAFLGAYQLGFLGDSERLSAGILAALLVTWFSFLPSFIFILAGAPLVEATRHNPRWQAPLSAITAAVVGVIANLAVFFIYHCFWPTGLGEQSGQNWLTGNWLAANWLAIDWQAAAIFVLALLLLAGKRPGLLPSLGICALLGLVLQH